MNKILRSLLFASSLAPAILVSALAQLSSVGATYQVLGWIAASGLACLLPLLVMVEASRRSAVLSFSAKKIESQDWLIVAFVVSYFVPLITKIGSLEVLGWVLIIAFILASTLDAIPVHPVLHLFRYRFYKVEGSNGTVYILITRRNLLSAADVKNVRQLSPQLLMGL